MNKIQPDRLLKGLGIAMILSMNYFSYAQVEHNFTMGPNNSTCDSLHVDQTKDIIELVRNTKFRFTETLKVSKYKVPNQLWYYSCDGKIGYVIAKEKEGIELIFKAVKKEDWKALSNAKDPVGSYAWLKEKYTTD